MADGSRQQNLQWPTQPPQTGGFRVKGLSPPHNRAAASSMCLLMLDTAGTAVTLAALQQAYACDHKAQASKQPCEAKGHRLAEQLDWLAPDWPLARGHRLLRPLARAPKTRLAKQPCETQRLLSGSGPELRDEPHLCQRLQRQACGVQAARMAGAVMASQRANRHGAGNVRMGQRRRGDRAEASRKRHKDTAWPGARRIGACVARAAKRRPGGSQKPAANTKRQLPEQNRKHKQLPWGRPGCASLATDRQLC